MATKRTPETLEGEYSTVESRIVDEFVWGQVQEVHKVGRFYIVEYLDSLGGQRAFHPYIANFAIDWNKPVEATGSLFDTHQSYKSLERAIVGAIVIEHDGLNSQLDGFFWRALQQEA